MEIFYTLPGTSKSSKQLKNDHIAITNNLFFNFHLNQRKRYYRCAISLYVKNGYSEQAPLKKQTQFVLDF